MPGYDTHYLFGSVTFRNLVQMVKTSYFNNNPENLDTVKNIIKFNKSLYVLGLYGPDIFFYSIPETLSRRSNIGSVIHTEKTDEFFTNMFRYSMAQPSIENQKKCLAYMCGFLGHYCLDSICHPYIYARTDYMPNVPKSTAYLDKHFSLETDIDIAMVRRTYSISPRQFSNSRIHLNLREINFVSDMLCYSVNNTFHDRHYSRLSMQTAIISIMTEQRIIKACSESVKNHLANMEYRIIGHPYISSLMVGDCCLATKDPLNLKHDLWINPWNKDVVSYSSFPELMNKAKKEYLDILVCLGDSLSMSSDNKTYEGYTDESSKLISTIKNRSYHSGFSCQ